MKRKRSGFSPRVADVFVKKWTFFRYYGNWMVVFVLMSKTSDVPPSTYTNHDE